MFLEWSYTIMLASEHGRQENYFCKDRIGVKAITYLILLPLYIMQSTDETSLICDFILATDNVDHVTMRNRKILRDGAETCERKLDTARNRACLMIMIFTDHRTAGRGASLSVFSNLICDIPWSATLLPIPCSLLYRFLRKWVCLLKPLIDESQHSKGYSIRMSDCLSLLRKLRSVWNQETASKEASEYEQGILYRELHVWFFSVTIS